MAMALTGWLSKTANPLWWLGPIFDKELRVMSRRRRYYVFRSAYLLILTALVAVAWSTGVMSGSGNSISYKISRMGEVGKNIILSITWCQFLVAQLAAVLMLSGSISDEIRRGTLDVLLTTPINSFQIVAGKLLGSTMQLLLLLAVALPVLIVVRVFGSMPWDYVVSCFFITLTATLLAGSLSMFLSLKFHRPYSVILIMLMLLMLSYGVTMVFWFGGVAGSSRIVASIIVLTNPFAAVMQATTLTFPGAVKPAGFITWPMHCTAILCLTMIVMFAAMLSVRRRSWTRPVGGTGKKWRLLRAIPTVIIGVQRRRSEVYKPIRRVEGSAMFWKELGKPLRSSINLNVVVFVILLVCSIPHYYLFYQAIASKGNFGALYMLFAYYGLALMLIASVRTSAMAALSIAREKEARTWPILLGTPLTAWQIVRSKAMAVLWRNLPLWLILVVDAVTMRCLTIYIQWTRNDSGFEWHHFAYSLISLAYYAGLIAFVIGTGMYFSCRLKSSTAAVTAALGSLLGFYILQQVVMLPVIYGLGGKGMSFVSIMLYQALSASIKLVIGLLLIRRTTSLIRRRVF